MKKSLCNLFILFYMSIAAVAQNSLWQGLPIPFKGGGPTEMYYDAVDDVSYITGTFSMVGEDSCNMVKWDGNALTLLPQAPIPYNITTVARYNGKIYVGGGLGLASWNGSTWTLLDDNAVFCLYPHEGKLYVAGGFTDIGGTGIGSLATWNDTAWSDVYQLDTFINSEGSWLKSVISYQDQLYVIGMMERNDGSTNNIIRFDGTRWRDVGSQIQGIQGPFANDLLVWNDTLYVGGSFRENDGGPGNGIAAWDGHQWHRLLGGVTYNDNPSISDMIVLNDELYVSGWFWAVNGIDVRVPGKFGGIAKWDGSQWCTLGTLGDGLLHMLGSFRDSLYLMGSFEQLNNDSMKYIAKWIGSDYTDSCSSEGATSIAAPHVKKEAIVEVHPNPANDVLNIHWHTGGSTPASLTIYDRIGREVMKREIRRVNNLAIQLPISSLSPGMYLMRITGDNGLKETHKFIKE